MARPIEKKWLVFYTKSRAEKKTRDLLQRFGFDCFLPLQTVVRQWSDRKKKVEVPLFNSYIFVYEDESQIPEVLKVPGVVWNIRHNGKPAVIRQQEMDMIKRFVETGYFVEASSDASFLKKGDKVEVMEGPLKGLTGILTGDHNEGRFSVVVEAIDQVLSIQLDKRILKFISEGNNLGDSYWKEL